MKLEGQLCGAIRLEHHSYRTAESYVGWYKRYVIWHGKRHSSEMGVAENEAFLTHLAVNRGVDRVKGLTALTRLDPGLAGACGCADDGDLYTARTGDAGEITSPLDDL